jgi:RHS repeat-associated protein
MFTDRKYTGQREVAGIGLYYYNARFYDAGLGRFISPDSIIAGARNPQALNRYAYALNSPMNVIDPSGHYGVCPGKITPTDDGMCGPGDYTKKETISDSTTIDNNTDDYHSVHHVLIAAFSGMQPYLLEQSDSSCGYCSWEPEIANPFEVLNLFFGIGQNIVSMSQKSNIFIYMNYYKDSYRNAHIPSLTIDNQSGSNVSVMNARFNVTSFTENINYGVSKESMIGPPNYYFGVRSGGNRLSTSSVNLVPTENLLYPDNTFRQLSAVKLIVQIANSNTGQYYPSVQFSFYPWQLEK